MNNISTAQDKCSINSSFGSDRMKIFVNNWIIYEDYNIFSIFKYNENLMLSNNR